MNKKKLNLIIDIIREMMTTGSTAGAPGFSEKSPATGPTAGFSPTMGMTKRKKYIYQKNTRKNWK